MRESEDPFPDDEVSDAFAVLSDETRLAVVRVLGDSGGVGTYQAVPFSRLQERVGVEDSGRFSYHLDKLVGRFVERTDRGYRLRIPGVQVYQAIQAGVYADHESVGPLETDVSCPCGHESLVCEYEDFRFDLGCPECGRTEANYPIDPESFDDDLPGGLLRAADLRLKRDAFSMELGFCPYCAGPVEATDCGQHPEADESDELAAIRMTCDRCHWSIDFRTYTVALIKPAVVGSFAENNVITFDVAQWSNRYEWRETLVSEDPYRIQLEMWIDDAGRTVRFDDELDVRSVAHSP